MAGRRFGGNFGSPLALAHDGYPKLPPPTGDYQPSRSLSMAGSTSSAKIHSNNLLDLTAMQQYIRFGRDNSWHFDGHVLPSHPYRFAFSDWGFGNRGHPQKMRWNLTVASDQQGNVWVERTGAGSAAEAFGSRSNDRLLFWDGVALHHHDQVIRAMRDAGAGAAVRVDIITGRSADATGRRGSARTFTGLRLGRF